MCVQSQQQLAKVGRRIRPCVHGDVCDSRRAGRVRARKSRICCQRVFLFWCKPGWQLTQLSPSTCLVTSLSFHSSLCMQKCTDPALLCSLPHTDNSAGVDAPQCLQVAPRFLQQAHPQLVPSLLIQLQGQQETNPLTNMGAQTP